MSIRLMCLIWTTVLVLIVFPGCDDKADGDANVECDADIEGACVWCRDIDVEGDWVLTSENVLGSWVKTAPDSTETLEFLADGTFNRTDDPRMETYSLQGAVLKTEFEDLEADGERWYLMIQSTAAIVDDVLYEEAYVRIDGSGDSLDGTWFFVWGFFGTVEEDGVVGVLESHFQEETVTINGDTFQIMESECDFEFFLDPDDPVFDEDIYTESGTIRVEGNRLHVATTESIDEPEEFFGWRVADDVIVRGDLTGSPTDYGYQRQ